MARRDKTLKVIRKSYPVTSAKKRLKFFVFADLHMRKNLDDSVLEELLDAAKSAKPDYIAFLGDLVHTVEYIDDKKNFEKIKDFLDRMAEIAPFYIVIGNHDLRAYDMESDLVFAGDISRLWNAVEKNPRITVLHNREVETKDFYLAGMEQGAACYGADREGGANRYQRSILIGERPAAMRKALAEFLDKLHIPEKHDKPNILLLHSARFLGWREMRKWVTDFDVIMSGHLHNMAIPPRAFEKTMAAYGLGKKRGHFVCPPVSVFVGPKMQKRYNRYAAIVEIVPPEDEE